MEPSLYGHQCHQGTCFGCGNDNPIGLKADFTFDPESQHVKFIYNLNKNYNGAPGFGHGGILSTLLDESMGALCFHLGFIVMTDEMSFRFKKATPVEEDILCRAWFVEKEKRKLHLECKITDLSGEKLYVEGKGSFHILSPEFFLRKLVGGNSFQMMEQLESNKIARQHILDKVRTKEE
jgi:acyl-coenzyme A thioesterase PaaI-like protein